MAVFVHRVGVVGLEVVAVDVVDEPVAVVVDAVAGDLAGVDPDVVLQVRVQVVDTRVDNRHDDVGTAGGDVPGLGGVDVGVGQAVGLAGVVQADLLGEPWVVGERLLSPHAQVGFEARDQGMVGKQFANLVGGGVAGIDQYLAGKSQAAEHLQRVVAGVQHALDGVYSGSQFDRVTAQPDNPLAVVVVAGEVALAVAIGSGGTRGRR